MSQILAPGDALPKGGNYSGFILGETALNDAGDAANATINDDGDVAFEAHLAGAECIGADPSALGCFATGVYLRKSGHGPVIFIAKQGDLDPLGAPFRHTWGPLVNNSERVLFVGD